MAIDEGRLGGKAARIVATTPYDQLAISDVTLQEIGLLQQNQKISFVGSPAKVLGPLLEFVTVLPITLEIALAAPALPLPHGDLFDRIITATAKAHRLTLLTKDANITDSDLVSVLW